MVSTAQMIVLLQYNRSEVWNMRIVVCGMEMEIVVCSIEDGMEIVTWNIGYPWLYCFTTAVFTGLWISLTTSKHPFGGGATEPHPLISNISTTEHSHHIATQFQYSVLYQHCI